MELRLSVITLGVADLARSRVFYAQGLGWTVGGAEDQIVFDQLHGLILALYLRDALVRDVGDVAESSGFAGMVLAHNVGSPREGLQECHALWPGEPFVIKARCRRRAGGHVKTLQRRARAARQAPQGAP